MVAVVDTGLDYTHPDIVANVWTNPTDGSHGYNFVADTTDPMDDHGHGTHVAGTIAAVGNNGLGIIGVAPQAKIMPVKALDASASGTFDQLARGIVYAAQNGADVINNSWGCKNPCPSNPVAEDAVRTAYGLGAVVVFAAGNSSDDVRYYSPQNMTDPKPIVVSASGPIFESSGTSFTNFGTLVDIAAPGDDILSLKAKTCAAKMCPKERLVGGNYLRQDGTSMASPHAAGVAALVLTHYLAITNDEIRQILRASADGQPLNPHPYPGPGRINAARALTIQAVPQITLLSPSANATLDPQVGTVTITGTAAEPDFQSYQLFYGVGTFVTEWVPIGAPVLSPVTHGVLGRWSVTDRLVGAYALKLVVTSRSGFQFQDVTPVVIERPLRRITQDQVIHGRPSIWGDRIVWSVGWQRYHVGGPNSDIYIYDLVTNTERRISATTDGSVAIFGDRIVWFGNVGTYDNPDWSIYIYDLVTNTERRIGIGAKPGSSPRISDNWVVWLEGRNGRDDLYVYDLTTNAQRRITTDQAQLSPYSEVSISGDRIVWNDKRNGNWDIYLYDLVTNREQQITADPSDQYDPNIQDYRIVWRGNVGTIDETDWDFFLYDLVTNTERRITIPSRYPSPPVIWGRRIVWADARFGNYDIYLYDLVTNREEQITGNPGQDGGVAIWGNRIVWSRVPALVSFWDDIYILELPADPVADHLGSISGQVRARDGLTPISGVRLDLARRIPPNARTCGPTPLRSTTTDANGYFSFGQLNIGRYLVCPNDARWKFLPRIKSTVLTLRDKTNAKFFAMPLTTKQVGTPAQTPPKKKKGIASIPPSTLAAQPLVCIGLLSVAPPHFSPNVKGGVDQVTFQGSVNHPASWQLQLTDSAGKVVQTFSGTTGAGTSLLQQWDGKVSTGVAPAGTYTYQLLVTDASGSQDTRFGTVIVDPPTSPPPAPTKSPTQQPAQTPSKPSKRP